MKTDKNSRTHTTSGTDTHPEQAVPDSNPTQAALPKRERISYEKWLVKYRPIKNPFHPCAPYEGRLFVPHGADFEFVRKHPLENIWTLVDDGDRNLFICEGCFPMDFSGYFVTEIAAPANRIFRVKAKPFYFTQAQ